MRDLLRRIGARTGISLGLVLVIGTIVLVFRLLGGPTTPPLQGPAQPVSTVAATAGDDGAVASTPTSYPDDVAVLAAATGFTQAWLRRTAPAQQWLNGMRPFATEDLLSRLAGVDPLAVPADASAGTPAIVQRSAVYADIRIPIGTGDALALGLFDQSGHWLVGTLDRETG
jgi:hypothetical protein